MATLIGDVIVGPRCYVGPGAALRGDFGRIVVGAGSNVQDNCVLHTFPAKQVVLEEDAHIGHAAVLHGCIIRRGALVGINAIVMDDADVGEQALVGAGSFIRAGFVVPPRMLAVGAPARVIRQLSAEELEWKAAGTRGYQELTRRCRSTLIECEPLRSPEAERPEFEPTAIAPLNTLDRGR
jgi:phenylacetic acid degradation protein